MAKLIPKNFRRQASSINTLSWLFLCLIFATLGGTQVCQANSFQLWASSMTLRSPAGPEIGMDATYAYDFVGNMTYETHGNGQAITHIYDRLNRLERSFDGTGTLTIQSYDENGNVKTSTDANGRTSTFVYNGLNQKTNASLLENRSISMEPTAQPPVTECPSSN